MRQRYDGRLRNPWNEYECGSFYARAMASYSLLASWSGFRYSAVEKTLWFGPQEKKRLFQVFFSTASGFGTICLKQGQLAISVLEGSLEIGEVVLNLGGKTVRKKVGKTAIPTKPVMVQTYSE